MYDQREKPRKYHCSVEKNREIKEMGDEIKEMGNIILDKIPALLMKEGSKRTLPKDPEITQSPSTSSPSSKKQKDEEADESMQDKTLDTTPDSTSDNQSISSEGTKYTDSPVYSASMNQTPVALFGGASPISGGSEST
jgi:hypothetical protein